MLARSRSRRSSSIDIRLKASPSSENLAQPLARSSYLSKVHRARRQVFRGGAVSLLNAFDGRSATATITTTNVTDNIVNTLTNGPLRGRETGSIVTEGMTLVGELGPELVRLPVGSEVFPTGTGPTPTAGSTGATTHNHYNVYALTAPDLHNLIQKAEAGADVAHHLATEMSAQGFG